MINYENEMLDDFTHDNDIMPKNCMLKRIRHGPLIQCNCYSRSTDRSVDIDFDSSDQLINTESNCMITF